MARTFIRQETQIRNSDDYDDTIAAGASLETQTHIEGDLNALRSQLKRAIWDDGAGNWYDDIPTINSKKRAIRDLNFDLDDLESKKMLFRATLLTDITVTALQNWELLAVASSETPSVVAAVATTVDGAVVAQSALNGAGFNVHELIELSGAVATQPKNLVVVRDAATGQVIQSSGRDVFGLLQYESTGVDGAAFDDVSAGNRAKISFVRMNATFDDIEACPVGDIAGKTINYTYVRRFQLDNIPEDCFISDATFVDVTSSSDLSLDAAIDNQSGPATQTGKNIEWRIDDTYKLAFQDSTGAADIWAILAGAGGDGVQFNGANFDINNTVDADFLNGAKFDTGGTEIDIGVTAGVIGTTGAADLRVLGAGELYLDDGNQAGSTWAQTSGIKLSDTTAEWDAFEALFGEVSLLSGIAKAFNRRKTKVYANVTLAAAANVDVGGVAGGANLDTQLPDMSLGNFLQDYDTFLNGDLLRPGANSGANNDYYPGTSLANGQLKFEDKIKVGDVIAVVPYA